MGASWSSLGVVDASRASGGRARCAALLDVELRRPAAGARPGWPRSCGPTSCEGYGWLSLPVGPPGWAVCSPTTWAWARRCRPWPCSCRAQEAGELDARRCWWWRRPACVSTWAREAARFAPRSAGRRADRDRPRRSGARRWPEVAGARPRRHLLRAVPARRGGLTGAAVARAGARRGAVREEPPGPDLPVRPPAAGAVQAGDHRHAAGEQPDGPVVAAVDRRARAVPDPQRFTEHYRIADRARTATRSGWPRCGGGSGR